MPALQFEGYGLLPVTFWCLGSHRATNTQVPPARTQRAFFSQIFGGTDLLSAPAQMATSLLEHLRCRKVRHPARLTPP